MSISLAKSITFEIMSSKYTYLRLKPNKKQPEEYKIVLFGLPRLLNIV